MTRKATTRSWAGSFARRPGQRKGVSDMGSHLLGARNRRERGRLPGPASRGPRAYINGKAVLISPPVPTLAPAMVNTVLLSALQYWPTAPVAGRLEPHHAQLGAPVGQVMRLLLA